MRRIFIVALAFSLISLCVFGATNVYAAANTYILDELGLEVTVPSEYTVITEDTPETDPIFDRIGTTKSVVINHFKSSNIYLNAVSDSAKEEIVITMTENVIDNLNQFSDAELEMLTSSLVDAYGEYGLAIFDYEIYQHSQTKFVVLYFTDAAKTVHGLQYYTIYNGKAMNFTMRSYTGHLSSQQKSTIKKVVDSIKYNTSPTGADLGNEMKSFVYTDTETGTTFTVPANWKQENLTKDREFIDTKFTSTKDDGYSIIYGSTDAWEKLPASDKTGYTRADLNNDAFSKVDIAALYNTTANRISVVTYNGVCYYKGEITEIVDANGLKLSITMTQLLYFENGWMYVFQFSGTDESTNYADFEQLLKSVRYPEASRPNNNTKDDELPLGLKEKKWEPDLENVSTAILVVASVIVAVVVICIKNARKRKKRVAPEQEETLEHGRNGTRDNPAAAFAVCVSCGKTLPPDSAFCHICGARVEIKEK